MEHVTTPTTGPSILLALTTGGAIALCFCSFVIILVTSKRLCQLCLPSLSLRAKDPIVISLLGACFFGVLSPLTVLIGHSNLEFCYYSHKIGGAFYVWSYSCVNMFLLLKLRAVEAGLKARWYVKLQRIINFSALFSPPFAIVTAAIVKGYPVFNANGGYFCSVRSVWYLTVAFTVIQVFISVAYFILFVMPLISTEKHLTALRTGDMGKGVHAVIVRNLIGCVGSTITTCVVMSGATVAFLQTDPLPGMWACSGIYIDLMVAILSCLYAIRPAWRYSSLHPRAKLRASRHTLDHELIGANLGIARWLVGDERSPSQAHRTLSPSMSHRTLSPSLSHRTLSPSMSPSKQPSMRRLDKDSVPGHSWRNSTVVTTSPSESVILGIASSKDDPYSAAQLMEGAPPSHPQPSQPQQHQPPQLLDDIPPQSIPLPLPIPSQPVVVAVDSPEPMIDAS